MKDHKERMSEHMKNMADYSTGPKQGYAQPMPAPDRHTALHMMNLLHDDVRSLIEEAHALRERLAPLLTGQESPSQEKRGIPPAASKLSAEIGEMWLIVQQARDIVRSIQVQLDL